MKNTPWLKLALASGVAVVAGAIAIQVLAAPSGWLNIDGNQRFAGGGGSVDWANSGAAGGAPCTNGGINVTGSGGLFNCGISNGSTTPPTAPLLVRSDPSIISAAFIVDAEAGDTTPCGSGDPTTTGGANGDAISSYNIAIGPVNNKTDISNVYAVSHTRADGHPELFFGAERLVNNGESHVDFEFLQSPFSLAPCATGVGALTGHRSQGDLLVAVDFTMGGSLAGFSVRQWHCNADPGPQPADGTVCDPAGGPEHYQVIAVPGAVSLSVNAGAIPCGGWVCRDASGNPTLTVPSNDLMEGGIDLLSLGFTGCFNTFLPHTRVSAPFNAQLSDFAGPVAFSSCRVPVTNSAPAGTVSSGASVHDTINLTNGGATPPQGTVTFFLCQPAQVGGSGCGTGTQVGAAKALVAGVASSDTTTATTTTGKYCWRSVFAPAAGFEGIYFPGSHTNATTECFNVVIAASLPNTGVPDISRISGGVPLGGLIVVPGLLIALAWRRSRSVAALLIAGVVAGSSPTPPATSTHITRVAPSQDVSATTATTATPSPPQLSTVKAMAAGWRLVIPRIGVDAQIQPVGRDSTGAMASPSSLESVGWFNSGPSPGQPGDAVIDGHYGVSQPAVFRRLHLLRPGDQLDVIWPDGRTVTFEVASSESVPASAHPPDVFSRTGPPRLSLITCSGTWDGSKATYSDRLIVTAMLT
jgi:sortase (surface protein transpeptidase)